MSVSLETISRARGQMKRDYIAQAAIIPKLLEDRAERMKLCILQLKRKEIEEWQLVDLLWAEMNELLSELPWRDVHRKLIIFTLADLERRRVEVGEGLRE